MVGDAVEATLTVDAVSVRYTSDQVAALCALFDRPDVLGMLDGDPGDAADDHVHEVAVGAAARTLVSGWIISVDTGPEADVEAWSEEDPDPGSGPRFDLLEPHADVLGALWTADQLIAVTIETDVAEELVVAVSGESVVERRPVVTGVHEFTLAARDGSIDRILDFLGVDPAQAAPPGSPFETTTRVVERLEALIGSDDMGTAPSLVAEDGAGFATALAAPIAHGRIMVIRRDGEQFVGDELAWIDGGEGWWLLDVTVDDPDGDGEGDGEQPVLVRPCSGADLCELIAYGDVADD